MFFIAIVLVLQVQRSEADKETLWPKFFVAFNYTASFWSTERDTHTEMYMCVPV